MLGIHALSVKLLKGRPVTSLGHQERGRVFWEWPKFFELCPIVLNDVQHIFQGGEKFSRGNFTPCAPPGYGPAEGIHGQRKIGEPCVTGCSISSFVTIGLW